MTSRFGMSNRSMAILGAVVVATGILAFALVATAADSSDSAPAAAADSAPAEAAELSAPALSEPATLAAGASDGDPSPTAASDLAVFKRAQVASDRAPDALRNEVGIALGGDPGAEVDEVLKPGALALADGRLVIDLPEAEVYAYPTGKSRACFWVTGIGGTCAQQFTDDDPLVWLQWGAGITGLIADNVVGVDLIIDGDPYPAQIGDNAFFGSMPADVSGPDQIIAHLSNGKSVNRPVGKVELPDLRG